MFKIREAEKTVNFIEAWLKEKVNQAGARGIVVGLSGGIDSAVVAALGRRAFGHDNILTLIMPCHSNPEDAQDAILTAEKLDINFKIIALDNAFDAIICEFSNLSSSTPDGLLSCSTPHGLPLELSKMSAANLKARLRMSTLYAAAQTNNFLVCGTGNKSEYETGYFTKYGDSASDLLPIADLLKTEVRAAAKYLGVPEKIIVKAPSAGLWENQTDEDEMGFSYDELDNYLSTGEAKAEIKERIEAMRRKSVHKRMLPPICKVPE